MNSDKSRNKFLYLLLLVLTTYFSLSCKDIKNNSNVLRNESLANSPEKCFDLSNKYQCYCSGGCAPRDKHKKDNPVWLENDPKGNKCYCQPWDLCKFDEKCDNNKNPDLKERKTKI